MSDNAVRQVHRPSDHDGLARCFDLALGRQARKMTQRSEMLISSLRTMPTQRDPELTRPALRIEKDWQQGWGGFR